MSDERLRELQRRWQETGAEADEARFLLEQVRLGQISRSRLEVAARLEHPAARLALGDAAPPLEPELSPIGKLWRRTEHEVRGRLVGWPSGTAFELSEWVRHLEGYGDEVALEAGRQLARQLAGDWPRLHRALEVLRPLPEPEEDDAAIAAVECVRIVVETQDPEAARESVRLGLIRWALGRGAPSGSSTTEPDAPDEDPISRLVDVLLEQARAEGDGEVRLEAEHAEGDGEVRLQGVAWVGSARALRIPAMVLAALIARLKYLVGLDLFETERGQSARRRLRLGELSVETYQAEGREACRARFQPIG